MFNVPCKLRYLQLRVITVGCYKRLSVKRTLKRTLHELKKIQQKHLTSRIYCHNGFDIPRSVSYDWPSNHGNYHEKNNALIWFEPTRGNTGWLRIYMYIYIYRCVCLFVYVFIFLREQTNRIYDQFWSSIEHIATKLSGTSSLYMLFASAMHFLDLVMQ